jgi:hypothetical protein
MTDILADSRDTGVLTVHGRLTYPRTAKELLEIATQAGWHWDDGLPVRTDCYNEPFIRVMVGRPPGQGRDGFLFHLTWRCSKARQFHMGKIFMYRHSTRTWTSVHALSEVRSLIWENRTAGS